MSEIFDGNTTYFTALTGTAAAQLERATTLHAWAGIRSHDKDMGKILRQVRRNPNARQRWLQVKRLIIDEISMMSVQLFTLIDYLARHLRPKQVAHLPFAGIQLILSGDFLQLPPVDDQHDPQASLWTSELWLVTVKHTLELKTVFRQKDLEFTNFLDRIRRNAMLPTDYTKLHSLKRPLIGLETPPLRLTPHRKTAEADNMKRLAELPGPEITFEALDAGPEKDQVEALTRLPMKLVLKAGAQVMLLRNFSKFDLVNGSIGIVQGFQTVAVAAGKMSVLETAKHPSGKTVELPVVRFNKVDFLVGCDKYVLESKIEDAPNSTRLQLPLCLAWTCTIHKSQGMTAEALEVDLTHIFEYGQAYVALSRARSFDTLQVSGFNALKLRSDPNILAQLQTKVAKPAPINTTSPPRKKPKTQPRKNIPTDVKQPSIKQFFAIKPSNQNSLV